VDGLDEVVIVLLGREGMARVWDGIRIWSMHISRLIRTGKVKGVLKVSGRMLLGDE
jgi:hypothetical protein